MAKKLKLLGGSTYYKGKQYRCIVLASSQKQAAEITGEAASFIRSHFCETGNAVEIEVAQGFDSGMWIAPLNERKKEAYIKIK